MKENIDNYNAKEQYHGYQEWYDYMDNLWHRGCYKNDLPIGYIEENKTFRGSIGDDETEVEFHIR